MPYKRDAALKSPVARMHAARDYYAAKDAAWNDEGAVLLRTVRAEMVAMHDIAQRAGQIFEAENKPVLSPRATGLREIHPTRAKALAAFVEAQGWSEDHLSPVEPMRTENEIADELGAVTKAGFERAQAALETYEAERHFETMGHYPEGYEPPDKVEIVPLQAAVAVEEPVVIPTTEEPKRRGRPPRVLIDYGEDVLPE